MKAAQFKGGYCFRFQGAPSNNVEELKRPARVRLGLEQPGLAFEPVCEVGKKVAALEAVAQAKDAEGLKLVSPLAGEVSAVESDKEAALRYIEVKVEGEGGKAEGSPPGDSEEEIRKAAVSKGLWLRITDAFTGSPPALDSKPDLTIVRASFTEPFLPDEQKAVEGKSKELAAGITALNKMAGSRAKTAVCMVEGKRGKALGDIKESGSVEFWELPDKYPAESPGLLDGLIRGWKGRGPGATWVVGLQELLALDELSRTGTYDPRWTISLGGQALKSPCHATVWPGTLVDDVLSGRVGSAGPVRKVVGGLMTGVNAPEGAWIEPPIRSVTAVPEHVHREFIGFTMPGFDKDSFSYGFASLLLPGKKLPVHAGIRGQHRYCISCSYCEWVCPADINPQILWKLVDVKEMEEASAMGLMRCIGCGLCSYVCPCKLELVGDLTGGIEEYRQILEEEAALKAKMG